VYVALIHTSKATGGKRFLNTLERLTARGDLHTWNVQRKKPLTLVHSQRPAIRVTFLLAGTRDFTRGLGAYRVLPQPAVLATVSAGPTADQALGFLVGMLARKADTLGVASISIPLADSRP
jgi:hypothetical protein